MDKLTKAFYDDLEKIIKGFATKKKIFSNEAQFQFELAKALAELEGKDYTITFEHLTYNKDTKEKMYTDLIVKDEKGNLYAIELKYKTPDKMYTYTIGEEEYYTFGQGAEDSGCYDYLKDVERLERLILDNRADKVKFKYKGQEKKIKSGFAIILTNNSKYYKHPRNNHNYYWESFFLKWDVKNPQTIGNSWLYWRNPKNGNKEVVGKMEDNESAFWEYVEKEKDSELNKNYPGFKWTKERYKEIKLENEYTLLWQDYNIDLSPNFKYLILTVEEE